MRTEEELGIAVEKLLQQNYYAEDFELYGSFQNFERALEGEERSLFEKVVLRRLADEPSIVNVMICSVVRFPAAVPVLVSMLESRPSTSQLTRVLIRVLGQYGDASAYGAIERFLDSDQEGDALTALASLKFRQTVFHLYRYAARQHLLDHCLHILHDRRKVVGMDVLIADLRAGTRREDADPVKLTASILMAKSGDYSPFSPAEKKTILEGLGQAG